MPLNSQKIACYGGCSFMTALSEKMFYNPVLENVSKLPEDKRMLESRFFYRSIIARQVRYFIAQNTSISFVTIKLL